MSKHSLIATIIQRTEVAVNEQETKEKKSSWNAFVNFLAMGGSVVIMVLLVVIGIAISSLMN